MSNTATPNPIESQLTPGVILSIYFDTINPPNYKFVVLIEINDFPLFFFINSEINKFTKTKYDLLQCQVRILRTPNHQFLRYDSFIDCSKMKSHYSKGEFLEQIQADPKRIVGVLDQSTRSEVVRVITQSRLYSAKEKELIRKNLSN